MAIDQRVEIEKSVCTLLAPDQTVEVRLLGVHGKQGHVAAGWFNDKLALVDEVLKWEAKCPIGTYLTINPVPPEHLERSPNVIAARPKESTKDKDVLRRHWLPIDFDACRPAETSSSREEHQAAYERMNMLTQYLTGLGFPLWIGASSGNGCHALYRIDLPADDGGLVKRCLEALHSQFSDDVIKIDTVIHNPSRILRLYGTAARKGKSTPERPHRHSRLIAESPPLFADVPVVPRELLEELVARLAVSEDAAEPPQSRTSSPTPAARRGRKAGVDLLDLEPFMTRHGIRYTRKEPYQGEGTKYILEHCVFNDSHNGTSAALFRLADGTKAYKCQHNSCDGLKWKDVKNHFEPDGPPAEVKEAWVQGKKQEKAKAKGKKDKDDDDNAFEVAKDAIRDLWWDGGKPTIRNWRNEFMLWIKRHYAEADCCIQPMLTQWLGENGLKTRLSYVSELMNCIKSIVFIPPDESVPLMSTFDKDLKQTRTPIRDGMIAMANGRITLRSVLESPADCPVLPHDPDCFTTWSLPYAFDPAATCPRWFQFLREVFDGDHELSNLLAEWFGYCLTDDISHHKILMTYGPPRTGKSTALTILARLVGDDNVCHPSLDDLAESFGMQQILGKKLAICADAHMGFGAEARKVTARLKTISGGDKQSVNRKNQKAVQAALRCKWAVGFNDLLRFPDTAEAMVPRSIIVPFNHSFIGVENRHLTEELTSELPGIFNWAISGLRGLIDHGDFSEPAVCVELKQEMARQGNVFRSFVEECCSLRGDGWASTEGLWAAWKHWSSENGHNTGNKNTLIQRLKELYRVERSRRGGGSRDWGYNGIEIVSGAWSYEQ